MLKSIFCAVRTVFFYLFIFLFIIFSLIPLGIEWIIGRFRPSLQSKSSLAFVQWFFRICLFLAGVKLTVEGREHIPDDQPVLYVGNHRSYFDILIGYVLVKGQCGFVAKKELDHFWIVNLWMRNLHCLFLDRENMKEGLKTILKGIEQIKSGISVWIYPEGTRNKGEEGTLLPYKEGSLKIAEKSGCPVIPVVMTHTADILENHVPWIHGANVHVVFGEPILLRELPREQRKFAGAYTQQVVQTMLTEQLAREKNEIG